MIPHFVLRGEAWLLIVRNLLHMLKAYSAFTASDWSSASA